jgi:hypothetical protein
MSRRRPALTAVLVAGAMAGAFALSAPPAVADPAACWHDVPTDFDGGGPDVVIGLPSYDLPGKADAGAIVVFSNVAGRDESEPSAPKASTLLTADDFDGLTSQAGARFGAAVVVWLDVPSSPDSNGCAGLLVGAPGQTVDGKTGAGQVYRLAGDPGGLHRVVDVLDEASLDGTGGAQAGAGFGSAIAAVTQKTIAIGAPGRDVAPNKTDAGRVDRIDYGATGDPVNTVVQQTGLAGGTAEDGDRFGEVLELVNRFCGPAARGDILLVVGVPHEDIRTRADAGIVTVVSRDDGFSTISQNSVAGASAEAGDEYGAALDVFGTSQGAVVLAIGVPGEDLGVAKNAGLVSYASMGPAPANKSPLFPLHGWARTTTQASPGVPGSLEAGDEFGAAVLLGQFGQDGDKLDLVVASPLEDLGSASGAGMLSMTRIKDDGSASSGPQPGAWTQDSPGVYGVAEDQDRFGRRLGWVQLTEAESLLNLPVLIVTVSREDVGTMTDAGMAYLGYPPGTASVPLVLPDPQAGAGLGMAPMQLITYC